MIHCFKIFYRDKVVLNNEFFKLDFLNNESIEKIKTCFITHVLCVIHLFYQLITSISPVKSPFNTADDRLLLLCARCYLLISDTH